MGNRFGKCVRALEMVLLLAAGLGFGGSASAILLDRGPDMVYDTVLDITWTRQAGDGVVRNWNDANTWAAGFSINDPTYGLIDDWRLPYASVSAPNGGVGPIALTIGQVCTGAGGADEVACRDNEMAYMFFYNLGGTYGGSETGSQTAVGGAMLTGIGRYYVSGTENFPTAIGPTGNLWYFLFDGGYQNFGSLSSGGVTWAVRPGDVIAAAPEPASLLLVGLGLAGLGFSRRKQA